jgi:hypothetical protein
LNDSGREETSPRLRENPRQRRPRAAAVTEFGMALDAIGLPQNRVATLLQVSCRHIRRWRHGDRRVPRAVRLVINLLVTGAISIDQVEQAAVPASAPTNGGAKPETLAPFTEASQERSLRPHVKTPAPAPVPTNPGPTTLAEKVCRLTAEVCHFPIGDPRHSSSFYFCNAPVVTPPYCERHHTQAHIAPRTGAGPVAHGRQPRPPAAGIERSLGLAPKSLPPPVKPSREVVVPLASRRGNQDGARTPAPAGAN